MTVACCSKAYQPHIYSGIGNFIKNLTTKKRIGFKSGEIFCWAVLNELREQTVYFRET